MSAPTLTAVCETASEAGADTKVLVALVKLFEQDKPVSFSIRGAVLTDELRSKMQETAARAFRSAANIVSDEVGPLKFQPVDKTAKQKPQSHPRNQCIRGLDDTAARIWAAAPIQARQRSSKKELRVALGAAVRRGHKLADIDIGVDGAYRSESYAGKYAPGIQVLIRKDRWLQYVPNPWDGIQ